MLNFTNLILDCTENLDCSSLLKKLKCNYVELSNLPISSILNHLFAGDIITNKEKKEIKAIPRELEEDRMEYFLDNIIIPSLKSNNAFKFKGFLEVLKDSDNPVLTTAAKNLGM